jgi:hypothetical protein
MQGFNRMLLATLRAVELVYGAWAGGSQRLTEWADERRTRAMIQANLQD